MDVQVGQVWLDKDSRMEGRRVVVTAIDAANGWVRYSPAAAPNNIPHPCFSYRSMLRRFPKAFRPEENK